MDNSENTWLSLDETADYLKMGKTALYALAQHARIPVKKIGKKWIFEKKALDTWVKTNEPVETFFMNLDLNIEQNESLRDPQRSGYIAAYNFFKSGKRKAIIQIPVGCGKTGLAAILPLGIAQGRAIVIAPNLTIKDGLYEAMDITNRQKCFWRKSCVLAPEQMLAGPFACTLDSGNISTATKSHIVITNVQQLATNADKWLTQFPENFFDIIIVDEAHHSAASSWQKVIDRFSSAKVILMTATPFRSDKQELDGDLIYRYPFRSASLKGYVKRLKASYVAPSQIELVFSDSHGKIYTLDDVLQLKEEVWFSRGVALSRLCNQGIVDNSLAKLEELRMSGTQHQLIAVACSINHAKEIRSLYIERGFSAEVIHSNQKEEEQEAILASLRNGTLDCIVQVQMLGEGFDHPKLSVAAIFRPFRSLAPYIQFVGRIMRVVVQNDPAHPDNLGHIVTHLGMNLDQRLKEFKLFENDDKIFWEKVIGGEEPDVPSSVTNGSERLRAGERVVVNGEIIESIWEEDFTTAEDQHVIEELKEKLRLLGLDENQAEEIYRRGQQPAIKKVAAAEPFLVQPQKEWEEARKRVNEQAQRLAKLLLNHVQLDMVGIEIPRKYTSLNLRGRSNYVSALMMVNAEFNKKLGKSRNDATTEDFKLLQENLDDILQKLSRRLYKAKSDYEESQS